MTPGGRGSSIFCFPKFFFFLRVEVEVLFMSEKQSMVVVVFRKHAFYLYLLLPSCGITSPIHAASMRSTSSVGNTSW